MARRGAGWGRGSEAFQKPIARDKSTPSCSATSGDWTAEYGLDALCSVAFATVEAMKAHLTAPTSSHLVSEPLIVLLGHHLKADDMPMRHSYGILLPIPVLLSVVSGGCVQTKAAVVDVSAQRAPICPDGVKLFQDSSAIGQPWELVAILTSTGETGSTSVAGMMNSQRKKAAKVGANGVILGRVNEPSSGAKVAGAFLGTGTRRTGDAMAIFIPGDSERVARACVGAENRVH